MDVSTCIMNGTVAWEQDILSDNLLHILYRESHGASTKVSWSYVVAMLIVVMYTAYTIYDCRYRGFYISLHTIEYAGFYYTADLVWGLQCPCM